MEKSHPHSIAGIDPAWKPEGNHSAISYGKLSGKTLYLENIDSGLFSVTDMINSLNRYPDLHGVAVDASLIIPNQTGSRVCEKELTKVYGGKRKAGCYPTNLNLHSNSSGLYIEKHLSARGFEHLNSNGKFMLETYPHASLIEIFDLPERLAYKKGKVDERRNGQVKLGNLLLSLGQSDDITLTVPEHLVHHFLPKHIKKLSGQALKHNEDVLDSIVCLYAAALFAHGIPGICFPDCSHKDRLKLGYVWVPKYY